MNHGRTFLDRIWNTLPPGEGRSMPSIDSSPADAEVRLRARTLYQATHKGGAAFLGAFEIARPGVHRESVATNLLGAMACASDGADWTHWWEAFVMLMQSPPPQRRRGGAHA